MDETVLYICRTDGCRWRDRPRVFDARMDTGAAAMGQGLFIRVIVLCGDCGATLEAEHPAEVGS